MKKRGDLFQALPGEDLDRIEQSLVITGVWYNSYDSSPAQRAIVLCGSELQSCSSPSVSFLNLVPVHAGLQGLLLPLLVA